MGRPERLAHLLLAARGTSRQEDATQNADYERRSWRPSVPRTRPASEAERVLLGYLGFALPSDLTTVVRYPSGGVRHRAWPALVKQREAMQ